MKKLITVALSLMLMVGLSGLAVAGSLDSPGAPSAGSGMYTLQNLYDYLTSGAALTVQSSFQEPTSGPGSTMKTTKQIGDALKALFEQSDITAADVAQGKKFICTQPGNWGIRTGTALLVPTPTQTPTITSTPTPTMTATPTWGCGNSITDSRNGKAYNTVLIGTQCWMKENMDYNNGCTSNSWSSGSYNACSYYSGGPYANEGLLYQWEVAYTICPSGWHLPTGSEWHTLESYYASGSCTFNRIGSWDCSPAGTALKTGGTSGFDALMAGTRSGDNFNYRGEQTNYWTQSQGQEPGSSWWDYAVLGSSQSGVLTSNATKDLGFSVRCIKN